MHKAKQLTIPACLTIGLCAGALRAQQAAPSVPPDDRKFVAAIMESLPPQPQSIPLYEGAAIPNSKSVPDKETTGPFDTIQNVTRPIIQAFLPSRSKANGAGVVIFPGGGYSGVSMGYEGTRVAEFFQDHGTAAFIVKYRLPSDASMEDKSIGPLQDAQQAIRLVRQHAGEWKLDPARIGAIGFSAGGHLAATLGTHFDKSYIPNPDQVNLRPDFLILVYPVISMDAKIGHPGSRLALLGPNPSDDQIRLFSNELQVTGKTPPALILQAVDDHLVDVDNSIVFFEALRHHSVPVEMMIFDKGDHGLFPLPRDEWQGIIQQWLETNGWLNERLKK